MANSEDKITRDGRHYQEGLREAFGVPDGGEHARELYEEGMRKYHEDPVAPIVRRYKQALKQLHKPKNWNAGEYYEVEHLASDIEGALMFIVAKRMRLMEIANRHGIKVKKVIMV